MKVLFIVGSLGWSFPARLDALKNKIEYEGGELYILELFSGYSDYVGLPKSELYGLQVETLFKNDLSQEINPAKAFKRVMHRLDEINPDVIFGGQIQFIFGAASLKWAKNHNKAFVGYDDSKYNTFERNAIVTWARSVLIGSADAMLVPTHDWDESGRKWGFKKEQLFYGYNVVDNKYWQEDVLNPLQSELPSLYYINIVRQVEKKNLNRLVIAHNRYVKNGGHIPLVLIGSGPEHESLLEIAQGNDKIIFLPEQKDLRGFYRNAKFMFLPSNKMETWGLTTNEAMASGVPCCVSYECGSSSLIEEGVNGFLYHYDDEKAIEDTFFKAERISEDKYKEMKAKALETISQWGLDKFVEGAYNACLYANNHKKKLSLFARIILLYWKGH